MNFSRKYLHQPPTASIHSLTEDFNGKGSMGLFCGDICWSRALTLLIPCKLSTHPTHANPTNIPETLTAQGLKDMDGVKALGFLSQSLPQPTERPSFGV